MTPDTRILRALRGAGDVWVSGAELAQTLGVSRTAVWARIEELRALGYEITAIPHRGYRLTGAPDALIADDLVARLPAETVIGREVRVFKQTTSTNDVVEKLARDGVKEGVVVFAETQTRGRGRLGRSWDSQPGCGLWLSVLLRPVMTPRAATQLTVAAAAAVARTVLKQTGLAPEIKWPNDILLRGRKLAGILTELSAELDRVNYVILGIGININHQFTDFPPECRDLAVSLREATGKPAHRADFAAALLRELDADYARLRDGLFSRVADEWERQCVTLGRQVAIHTADRVIHGRAESLDEDGALLVRTQHGRLERITGGDVSLAPLAT